MEISFLFLQGKQGLPPEGKTPPLGGRHGHLLVTPSSHHAVQKAAKVVENLRVKEILWLYDSKDEKHVKEILEFSSFHINSQFYRH